MHVVWGMEGKGGSVAILLFLDNCFWLLVSSYLGRKHSGYLLWPLACPPQAQFPEKFVICLNEEAWIFRSRINPCLLFFWCPELGTGHLLVCKTVTFWLASPQIAGHRKNSKIFSTNSLLAILLPSLILASKLRCMLWKPDFPSCVLSTLMCFSVFVCVKLLTQN